MTTQPQGGTDEGSERALEPRPDRHSTLVELVSLAIDTLTFGQDCDCLVEKDRHIRASIALLRAAAGELNDAPVLVEVENWRKLGDIAARVIGR